MTTAVQRRRGTTTEHASFTGLEGEISVNTTKETLVVHDGSTAGGFELARADGSNFVATSVDINGGTIDGTTIGVSSASTGAFTTLTASGEITANGGIALGDNDKATFGDGDDLQIYHSGTHSFIEDKGTGNLYIDGASSVVIRGETANTISAIFNDEGSVVLKHSGDTKLATTATGIDVTGTATMAGLTVDGGSTTEIKVFSQGRVSPTTLSEGASGAELMVGSSNPLTLGTASTDRLNIASNGDISFYEDTGTTPKFFWDASAESLGIGTSSPSARVDSHDNGVGLRVTRLSNPDQYIEMQGGNGSGLSHINANYQMAFKTGNTERMRIDSAGNVGIGVSSPSEKLEIAGAASATSTGIAIKNGSATRLRIFHNDNAGTNYISSHDVGAAQALFIRSGNNLLLSGGGGTEHARIDSSGNLLVGTTTTTFSDKGVRLYNYGNLEVVRPNDSCMELNRTGSDGIVARFHKDGTTVGSIGTHSQDGYSNFFIALDNASFDVGIGFGNAAGTGRAYFPSRDNGSGVSDVISIGTATYKYKDLYLSGGVYLGGTVAANKLDDYEEGTWTMSITDSSGNTSSSTNTNCKYTKIGNLVHAEGFIVNINNDNLVGGDALRIDGLPFGINNAGTVRGHAPLQLNNVTHAEVAGAYTQGQPNTTYALIKYNQSGGGAAQLPCNTLNSSNTSGMFVSITYYAA